MKISRLTNDQTLLPFDCGDAELNTFLMQEAKFFSNQRIANTYVVTDDKETVAFFCLLNDKIDRQDVAGSSWRKIKKCFPFSKHFSSYPAVKIGQFAVASKYHKLGLGSDLMDKIKSMLYTESSYSTFRFLTVDAYKNAVSFYEKNDFKILLSDKEAGNTQAMYFDMATL